MKEKAAVNYGRVTREESVGERESWKGSKTCRVKNKRRKERRRRETTVEEG